MNQKILWEIEYINGIFIYEDITTPIGDGGWTEASKLPIKNLSLITPIGKHTINLQNGQINNQPVFYEYKNQYIEVSNKDIIYKPIQRKLADFHFGTLAHQIGWEADFNDFKIKIFLSVDVNNYHYEIFPEEVN